jgi:hypothetical protein
VKLGRRGATAAVVAADDLAKAGTEIAHGRTYAA